MHALFGKFLSYTAAGMLALAHPDAGSRIGAVTYALQLPPHYQLAQEIDGSQIWKPARGEGFVFEIHVARRPAEHVGAMWLIPPCTAETLAGVEARSLKNVQGVDQLASVAVTWCLESTYSITCEATNTRGHLQADEAAAALAVCRTLHAG